jgi:hypothetical protein
MTITITITIEQPKETVLPEAIDDMVESIYTELAVYHANFSDATYKVESEAK